ASNENLPPNVIKQLAKELKRTSLKYVLILKDQLALSHDFPHSPPKGYFMTKIFHPNVASNGEICVNTLKKDWNPSLGLRHVLSDLKSSSEKEKGTRSKSVKNMKLRKAKEANQDICAIKTLYLTNQEEFISETGFPGFYTQQEHTANWFYTKRNNGLGDMPFTSQTIYTASELVLFKESNSLLKECATQTHVWKPGDHSLHLRPFGVLIPCTKPHWISQILQHLHLPFLEPICFKSQRLVFYTVGCDLAICCIN
ncbi:hypothetical protein DY000_02019745, partial [Brassica cretica]